MLTLFHANPALLDEGVFTVDRKFLLGMAYTQAIGAPMTSVHARLLPDERIMDPVSVPVDSLPYRVVVVDTDAVWNPEPHELPRLRALIAEASLVCHGFFNVGPLCAELGTPDVMVAEFDRRTAITAATVDAPNTVVKLVRGARALRNHMTLTASLRRAMAVHCNGYPIYDELASVNPRRLLYFDSRMSEDVVIYDERLERRLASRRSDRLRLIYSGRYEAMKGALDVVKVGLACLERSLDIELHLYGQGRQDEEMRALAAKGQGRIHVHDAVPAPALVEVSRDFDVFVCCHVQSDPSCTYLEAFGCGLPIVGYGNRMWHGLRTASQVGFEAPLNDTAAMVTALQTYADNAELLARHSRAARRFALEHTFEKEFDKRNDDMRRLLAEVQAKVQPRAQTQAETA